jgi:phosphate:Na+ symporter
MNSSFDIWKMLAGVAFFLLAMKFMEDSLRMLGGRRFKLFLKKHTKNKVKAIGAGAVVTGLLQSSSIVNLLILGMVGASIVKMENALAIMLGSNLGTTLDSWFVASLGFNFNIESYALPLAGITGIVMAFSKSDEKWFLWMKFIFSLAFLFIALGYIKTGMEGYVKQTDLSAFDQYPLVVFLLLGIFLTTIIQSSSATIAITLSALYAHAITFPAAMAIVLGAEIGTTVKLFLASINGLPVKKRVALGNFLFNLVTVIFVFFFLQPINEFITEIVMVKNNLIALVFFQSMVNLFSIIIFFPFLKPLSNFLMKRYDKDDGAVFISKVPVNDTELALEALESETNLFINQVIDYSLDSFSLEEINTKSSSLNKKFLRKTVSEKYEQIKHFHGEMHAFYLKLQNSTLQKKEAERLHQLISAIRNLMYAAKNIRDAQHDILQIKNSSNDIKYNFYGESREKLLNFYKSVLNIINQENRTNHFEELSSLYRKVTMGYSDTLKLLYRENLASRVSETEISTLINFNRELYTSFKSILFGLKDFLLTTKEAEYFEGLPGFIR